VQNYLDSKKFEVKVETTFHDKDEDILAYRGTNG